MGMIHSLLTNRGYLHVGAFHRSIGYPVKNARVRITARGNSDIIMEELFTDSAGQSPVVDLPAPPAEFSLNESIGFGLKPYSEYDVDIFADGFNPVKIEGVQVFPDIRSIQDVMLNELSGPVGDREIIIITIGDNTLYGNYSPKIPEEDVKELPPPQGFVVLPYPVIPEFIIVHMGAPGNKNAPRHWVLFKDYIKNVASSEIYATWPDQTLRANIHAIISFTLNRVYTEWYRGKGFDFTITNSTQSDQAFTYGRNIFDTISRVVDETFMHYATRPDIKQPLLTQCCDGRRVRCPGWLSQWGSKDLGVQGYSAINILKYYYGMDIFLMQAPRVEGVPASFKGVNLQVGSTGQDIRVIQEQISAISRNFPLIKRVRADGIFGQETRESVTTFQNVFNLRPSGIVDFPTWYRISDIYVAVTRIAELR